MKSVQKLLAGASIAALLAAPAAALTVGTDAIDAGTEMGSTLGVNYSQSGSTGMGTQSGGEIDVYNDRTETLRAETELEEANDAENTYEAQVDSEIIRPSDESATLGETVFPGEEMAESRFIGNTVVSADGTTLGQVNRVWMGQDGMQYFEVSIADELDLGGDSFLLGVDGNAEADGELILDVSEADFENRVRAQF